jgi:hypothetical protein
MSNPIRLAADHLGINLMRNNSGVLDDVNGRPIRFGLGHESSAIIKVRKSSDWIGITHDGFFVAFEEKPPDWVFRGTPHEQAQCNFINMIRRSGGLAGFVTSPQDVQRLFMEWRQHRVK